MPASDKKSSLTPLEVRSRLEALARGMGFQRFIVMKHPSNHLSKNGRLHYLQESTLKNKLKRATTNALQQMPRRGSPPKFYHIAWVYKGTRPDDDNIITRCKYARDAIAEFYGFDDRELQIAGFPCVDYVHDTALAGHVIIAFFDFPISKKQSLT